MGSIVTFAAVNAKTRALQRKFLTPLQYKNLIGCKNYKDAFRYLKEETSYHEILSNYSIDEIHRGRLEIILKKEYMKNFDKLSHYFNGAYRELFNVFFVRFEIEDLKVILRGKYVGKDDETIKELMIARGRLSTINYDSIISAKNIEDVVQNLRGTVYYKHILPLVNSVYEDGLFRIETALDFTYFSLFRKCLKKLNDEDREIIQRIIGTESDILNIQWVFRGKFYYNLSPEELLNYTIYDAYKLKREELKKMCYSHDQDEFYQIIQNLSYNKIFFEDKDLEYLVEKNINSYLKNMFDNYKKEGKMNISCIVAYLELQLIEMRDIISIIENIRYGVMAEENSKYVTAEL